MSRSGPGRAFRFVHCADVHLDTPFRSREDALRRELAQAGREAFRRMVDLSIDEQVHALLIAGDLFDDDRLSFTTERFLTAEIERLIAEGITVVWCTGNHDPGRLNYRAQQIEWPADGFHVLSSRTPQVLVVPDRSGEPVGRVVGAGHQTRRDTQNLASAFPSPRWDEPTVGLLHTQVHGTLGADAHGPYAPCSLADLRARPYDYWALGHVHTRQQALDLPLAHYPGNLQGRHFGETGAKGALVVEVAPGGEAGGVRFVPLAPIRWERVVLDDLGAVTHLGDLRRAAAAAVDPLRQDPLSLTDQRWMLRVELTGPCPLVQELRDEDQRSELASDLSDELDLAGVEVHDAGVTRPVDLDAHRGQPNLLGVTLDVLDDALRSDDLLDALVPDTLAGTTSDDADLRREYVRRLLDGASGLLAEALLRDRG